MADLDNLGSMIPTEKKTIESAFFDVMKDMTSEKKTNILSDISDEEVKLITRLMIISSIRNNPIYANIANTFMLLRMSKNRASRKEILEGIKNASPQQTPANNGYENLRRLLG